MRHIHLSLAAVAVLTAAACSTDRPVTPRGETPNLSAVSTEAPLHLMASSSSSGARPIAGQYIVVLKDAAGGAAVTGASVAAQHAVTPLYTYGTALKGFAARLTAAQLEKLRHDPSVAYIDQDGVTHVVQEPAVTQDPKNLKGQDPSVASVQPGATWGIDKLDQEWGGAPDGNYNYTDTGKGVNVYVVDTGIRTTHNDFDGLALNRAKAGAAGFDAFGGNGQDCYGHGTHVSGTIGGTTYGVAKGVTLYSVRVLDCTGSGTWSGFIAGVDWVTNKHLSPAVANASLGGGFVQAANDAVTKSVSWGVTWVIAAGNNNDNACNYSPSSTPAAITVAASDINNAKAYFSNWGPCVDLYGPGVNVTSDWYTSDNATAVLSGTSMATPHVAGLAALYLSANKTAAPGEVADAIHYSAENNVITGNITGTPNLLAHKINGSLAGTGSSQQKPDVFPSQWYYWANNPGYHHVWIRGTPGTNFNVEFYKWDGANWIKVAQKIGSSTNEYLVYYGAGAAYYMYLVKSASGGGTYDSWVIRPD